jgi:hypothetical protein
LAPTYACGPTVGFANAVDAKVVVPITAASKAKLCEYNVRIKFSSMN